MQQRLAILLFVGGGFLLVAAVPTLVQHLEYRDRVKANALLVEAAKQEITSVTVDSIFSATAFTFDSPFSTLKESEVLAIFLLRPSICAASLNEVFEYIEVIEESTATDFEIRPLVLVFSEDSTQVRHFLKVTDFPTAVGYGYSESLANTLGKWGSRVRLQQLTFVDTKAGKAFRREPILTRTSTPEHKREVLRTVGETFFNLRPGG